MATGKPLDVPWPVSSFPGMNPAESAGRLINVTAEQLGDPNDPRGPSSGAPGAFAWHRQPGLSKYNVTAPSQTGYRGGLLVGGTSYEVFSGNASTVDSAGTIASLGNLAGTKQVSIARNQAATADVIAVDIDNGAFKLSNGGGAPTAFNGAGVLPQPNSVCFQDGFLFFSIAAGQIYATQVNSLTMNALTFTTLTAKATTTAQRVVSFNGLLYAFTTASCEVWSNPGNITAPLFPFSRMVVLEYGLIQTEAIAGYEDGFSVLIWVAQDYGVYMLVPGSLQPLKISPPDLDRLIQARIVAGDRLSAGCYAFAGKKFWTISSSLWTLEFNLNSRKWNERWSLNSTLGQLNARWRGTCGHPAFGKWIMGDQQSGNLLYPDPTNYTENGAAQLCRMESGLVSTYPNRIGVPRADFNFVTGVGTPTVLNPQVAISWSNDNGAKWGNPLLRSLGPGGAAKTDRVSVKHTGQTGPQGRRWRWDVTDPVYVGFLGSTQSSNPKEY